MDAADRLAQVTREYYDDWLSQGPQLQSALMNLTTYENPGLADQEIDAGVGRVNSALDAADVGYKNRMHSYGIAPTAEQQEVNSRLSSLNRSSQVVNAANQIRQALHDRNQAIATGVSVSSADDVLSSQ